MKRSWLILLLALFTFAMQPTSLKAQTPQPSPQQTLPSSPTKNEDGATQNGDGSIPALVTSLLGGGGIAGLITAIAGWKFNKRATEAETKATTAQTNAQTALDEMRTFQNELHIRLMTCDPTLYPHGLFERCLTEMLTEQDKRKRVLEKLMLAFHAEPELLENLRRDLKEDTELNKILSLPPDKQRQILQNISGQVLQILTRK
jgi:hypothetical protein